MNSNPDKLSVRILGLYSSDEMLCPFADEYLLIRVSHADYPDMQSVWVLTNDGQLWAERAMYDPNHGMVIWKIHKLARPRLGFGAVSTSHEVRPSADMHPGIQRLMDLESKVDEAVLFYKNHADVELTTDAEQRPFKKRRTK